MGRKKTLNPAAEQSKPTPFAAVPESEKPAGVPKGIGEAMLRVMAAIPYVRKRGSMKSYKFVRDTDVIAALRAPMIENGLMLTGPHAIRNRRHEPKTTTGGAAMNFAHAEYLFRIEFVPTGEFRPVWVVGEGADSLDKASNKSMSAARKYALILAFNLMSGEDPDQFDEEGRYGGGDEEAEPTKHDHGNAPPAPKAPAPAAQAAPPKVLPENGEQLEARLRDYESRLVKQGQCETGELLAHVRAMGAEVGYPANFAEWNGKAIEFAVEATRAFDPAKIKAERESALAAERAALAANAGDKEKQATEPKPAAQPEAEPKPAESKPAAPTPQERYAARIERMNASGSVANLDKFRELYTRDTDMSADQKRALEECYWSNVKRIREKK